MSSGHSPEEEELSFDEVSQTQMLEHLESIASKLLYQLEMVNEAMERYLAKHSPSCTSCLSIGYWIAIK